MAMRNVNNGNPDYKPYGPGEMKEYEEKLLEDSKVVVKTVKEYQKELYEEKRDEKDTEILHQKISTPVIKGLIKDMQSAEKDIQPLEDIGTRVSGTLFDRLKFLRERIFEMEEAISDRETLNTRFNKEIDKDIEDLEVFLQKISDKQEIREFKLNVTLLRMEKRKENNQFWRDITLLKKQLRELKEEHESELKISNIFSGKNIGM